MKVVLVNPSDLRADNSLTYPPLGLLYVASMLKDRHDVSVFDMRDDKISNIPMADVYGFTSTTYQITEVKKLSRYLKKKYPSCFTVVGGSHVSALPSDAKGFFDCVIVGEGERVVNDVINDKTGGVVVGNSFENIDMIPFPSRYLLPAHKIANRFLWHGYRYGMGPKATILLSSRGCPFKCRFCTNIRQPVRFRSVDNFVSEIKTLIKDYGCRHFRFVDDHFTLNKNRLFKICDTLLGLDIRFRCSARSDSINDDVCKALYDAGCREIGFGVETADDDILKVLDKTETVDQHKNAIKTAKKHGLRVKIFMMTGLPYETWATIEQNKKFISDVKPDKIIVTLFTPYPGCDIWEHPDKYDIAFIDKDFSNYHQSYPNRSNISTKNVSSEELTEHFNDMIKFISPFFLKNI